MNLAYACLVLLACICFARGETHDLIKTVVCDENGKLTATIDTTYWSLPTSASCASGSNANVEKRGTGNILVLTGCPMGGNVVFTATHNYTTPNGKVAITAAQDKLSVTLRCDAIKTDKHLTASSEGLTFIGTHNEDPINKSTTENIKMVMELRSPGGSSSTNSMDLGATYDLLIAGAGNHDTVVTKCTAAGSANATGVTIFPRAETVTVLSSFTPYSGTKKTIGEKNVNKAATLTGFRLVGFKTVYLTCSITVCHDTCAALLAGSSTTMSSSTGSSTTVSSSAGSSTTVSSTTGSSTTVSSTTGSSTTGSSTTVSSSKESSNAGPASEHSKRSASAKSSLARHSLRKRSKHPTIVHYARLKLNVRDNSENMAENGTTGAIPVGNHMMRLIFLITIMKFIF